MDNASPQANDRKWRDVDDSVRSVEDNEMRTGRPASNNR
ncbi:hypothetical protein AGROH133_14775 (plasmid) [Agrobacterium tumefaciens]|nr:hypothetical protein AGROH133_14775 [Agrobacterium tumefaciens]